MEITTSYDADLVAMSKMQDLKATNMITFFIFFLKVHQIFKDLYSILELNLNVGKMCPECLLPAGKNALLVTEIVTASVLPSEILLYNYCLLKDLTDRFNSCQNPKSKTQKRSPQSQSPNPTKIQTKATFLLTDILVIKMAAFKDFSQVK